MTGAEGIDPAVVAVLDQRVKQAAARADADRLIALMTTATGEPARLWGPSIIGFGSYHYRYASGTEGDAPLVGFAARSGKFALYLTTEDDVREDLLARLGPHEAGASCVYVKRLADLDEAVLTEFIDATVRFTRAQDTSRAE